VAEVPALVRQAVHDELEQRAFEAGTVARDVIEKIVGDLGAKMSEQLAQRLGGQGVPAQQDGGHLGLPDGGRTRTWLVNGKMCRVPENFTFDTKLPAERLWELYCLGDAAKQIGPYSHLETLDLTSTKQKKRLSDMQALLEPVKRALTERNLWIRNPTIPQVHEMWREGERAIRPDGETAKGKKRRTKQLAWTTQLTQFRKRARNAGDDDDE